VRRRPEGTENPNMPTGEVEVLALELTVLNAAETPPFQLDDYHTDASEEVRLRTATSICAAPRCRSACIRAAASPRRCALPGRRRLPRHRDADPDQVHAGGRARLPGAEPRAPGQFYALPQSPQLFKQLLMMSGFDRYYQIARCFRDEDLRADRQPEFTQLDIEMSFVDEATLTGLMEQMIRNPVQGGARHRPAGPFPRMTYAEAMRRYGSDRPDLRVPLELIDVADLMDEVEFKVFAGPAADPEGRVVALRLPAGRRALAARRSTTTPSSSASTAPRAWPTSRSTTGPRRAARACSRRS
jgi:aspartyl-tRNA synthetase